MLGTIRLPFPAFSFDLVHCSRCLIHFTAYNAKYFLEVDRLLRPGGFLFISGHPVQWQKQDNEWNDLQVVARSLCYEIIVVDGNTAIWKKPSGDSCLLNPNGFGFHFCEESVDPSFAWSLKLKKCVSRITSVKGDFAIGVIPEWPERWTKVPSQVSVMKKGIGVFEADNRRWIRRVAYYKNSLNLKLGTPSIRNVVDMNAFFGGFAAAIASDPVWVMNVVPARKPPTLDVIYDRGLIGLYHDWCNLVDLMVEMDRILRPEGTVVIRDSPELIDKAARIRVCRKMETCYTRERTRITRNRENSGST
ncbi:putative pectin methyltransferase QUA3 [Primulina tabacum]|uniref:putative pectin methyltransferase QUA3 n=1 Tax=Primulina tabacum TaxID=48773 RepID=UPI003F59776F